MSERVELVAAAMRRHLDDIDMYAQFLRETLEQALPPGVVELETSPSLGDRLRGRPGPVTRLSVTLGERRWVLHPHRGAPRAEVVHVVRGMELDHEDLPLDTWVAQLSQALEAHAATSARTADALARVTDPSAPL